jgi:hypothetical protein
MSRRRIQTLSAVAAVALGAVLVWAISSLEGVREVHPRFPMAMQLYGFYLLVLAPFALMPTPLPALGRLGLWNALGIGIGGLVVGATRAGALLGIPVICIGIGLALWPPVSRPERERVPSLILGIGGALAVLLPAAWAVWG